MKNRQKTTVTIEKLPPKTKSPTKRLGAQPAEKIREKNRIAQSNRRNKIREDEKIYTEKAQKLADKISSYRQMREKLLNEKEKLILEVKNNSEVQASLSFSDSSVTSGNPVSKWPPDLVLEPWLEDTEDPFTYFSPDPSEISGLPVLGDGFFYPNATEQIEPLFHHNNKPLERLLEEEYLLMAGPPPLLNQYSFFFCPQSNSPNKENAPFYEDQDEAIIQPYSP